MLNQTCIISSNIRFASEEDGPNTWHNRKEFLASVINHHLPDILCSQEGRKPQILEFESSFPHLSLIDSHRDWILERMYPCIYLNLTKFECQDSGDFWLSETPFQAGSKSFNSAFPRLCTWAKVKNNKSFYIFNTHLDHLQTETRIQQAKVLKKLISQINSERLPYILCGDFNEGPTEAVHNELLSGELNDPWLELKLPEETSFHRFQKNFSQGKRIDWILSSKEITVPHILLDKSEKAPLFPSDHYPVIAHFSLIKDNL